MRKTVIAISVFVFAVGCIGAGTHGFIKAYHYKVRKTVLEAAMLSVIKQSSKIYLDTTKRYIIDVTNGKHDSILDNYYNDNVNYYILIIKQLGGENDRFVYRFNGDKKYWDTASSSEIFTCYEDDKNELYRQGSDDGSEGEKRLSSLFEKELISKIDSVLGISHTTEIN